MGVGQSRIDLTATALCADRPLLPQQGSVYRSQLARMSPRFNSWELGVVLWVFAGVHKKHQTRNHKRPSRGNKCLGNLCREKGVAW